MRQRVCACAGGLAAVVAAAVLGCGCADDGADALRRGIEELERGNPQRAVSLLEQAHRRLPDDANAALHLADAYAATGDLAGAVGAYRDAIGIDDRSAAAWRGLAETLADAGRFEEAAEALDRVLALDGADTASLLALGRARLAAGAVPEGLAALHAVLRRGEREHAAAACVVLAEEDRDRGDFIGAEKRLIEALAYDPDLGLAHLRLARLYEKELNRPSEAIRRYRAYLPQADEAGMRAAVEERLRALGGSPDTGTGQEQAAARTTTSVKPVERTTSAAPALSPEQQIIRDAEQALANGQNQEGAALFRRLADSYLARGSTDAALAALRRAAALEPRSADTARRIARLHQERGDAADALAGWKLVLQIDPGDDEALRRIADLSLEMGEADAAVEAMRRLVQRLPGAGSELLRLAQVYDRRLGLRDQALETYVAFLVRFSHDPRGAEVRRRVDTLLREAAPAGQPRPWPRFQPATDPDAAADPAAASARFREGFSAQRAGNPDEAVALYLEALRHNPATPEALYNLAICCRNQGADTEAVACYLSALALKPDYVSARYNLALLLEELGDVPAAIGQWQTLLQTNPDEPSAHLALGNLYAKDPATMAKARHHYARYVQLDPSNPAARRLRDWLRTSEPPLRPGA